MSHYIFKHPIKKGDKYREKVERINEFLIEQKAVKYGAIQVLSEKEYTEHINEQQKTQS